jgi:Rieske 2Fe-2S family protein
MPTTTIDQGAYFTSLPQPYYLSPSLYEEELEAVWGRQWLFAGHVSQIPEPGDFFTFEIARESLILIRGDDGAVHALYNVCRHRGFRICDPTQGGHMKRILCPYHAWQYGRDGELLHAPKHADGDPFAYTDYGLHEAAVEVWQGFIFVHLSDQPLPSIGAELAAADESMGMLQPERMKIVKTIEYPCAANWKLLMENELECYHCAPSHPELCNTLSLAEMHAHHNEWGPDRPYFYSWMPLKNGAKSLTMDGETVVKMPFGDYAEGREMPGGFASGFLIQPTCTFAMFYVDHGITAKLIPNSVGETVLVGDWFVHEDAVEGVDYDLDELVGLWDITHRQDIELANRQQLGIGSRKYAPGPDSKRYEPGIESALNLYLEMVGDVSGLLGMRG